MTPYPFFAWLCNVVATLFGRSLSSAIVPWNALMPVVGYSLNSVLWLLAVFAVPATAVLTVIGVGALWDAQVNKPARDEGD